MPDAEKDFIRTLIDAHRSRGTGFDDIVRNKGKGLIGRQIFQSIHVNAKVLTTEYQVCLLVPQAWAKLLPLKRLQRLPAVHFTR